MMVMSVGRMMVGGEGGGLTRDANGLLMRVRLEVLVVSSCTLIFLILRRSKAVLKKCV